MEEIIKKQIKQYIEEEINNEIKEQVKQFADKLLSRKDKYIAEVMKGIRIYHEQSEREFCMNYRIIFENEYKLKESE